MLRAQEEVENGITLFIKSRAEVKFLTASVAAALDALEISLIQYPRRDGYFHCRAHCRTESSDRGKFSAIAQGAVPLRMISTYRAIGGGWQLREGHDFVPTAVREEMAKRTYWGKLLSPELLQPQATGLPAPRDEGPRVRLPEW